MLSWLVLQTPVWTLSFSDIISQIDEAHERSVYTDLLLGVLKKYLYSPIWLQPVLITLAAEYDGNDPHSELLCHLQLLMLHPSWTTFLAEILQAKQQ